MVMLDVVLESNKTLRVSAKMSLLEMSRRIRLERSAWDSIISYLMSWGSENRKFGLFFRFIGGTYVCRDAVELLFLYGG